MATDNRHDAAGEAPGGTGIMPDLLNGTGASPAGLSRSRIIRAKRQTRKIYLGDFAVVMEEEIEDACK